MFKHDDPLADNIAEPKPATNVPTVENKIHGDGARPTPSGELLRELLEKNLKWSQIIYEQNRRINRRLTWAAIAEWLRLLFIVVPLVVGFVFLIPFLKQAVNSYTQLMDLTGAPRMATSSYESILQYLPVNDADKAKFEQLLQQR